MKATHVENSRSAFLAGYVADPLTGCRHRPGGEPAFEYSDGADVERRIGKAIETAEDLSSGSAGFGPHMVDWPSVYHLSPMRANLLRPFHDFLRGDVLELGAGCGAITRFLGECPCRVIAIEGSPRRAAIAARRCRDLPDVHVVVDDARRLEPAPMFDSVVMVGVLEYARRFAAAGGIDPVTGLLAMSRRFLRPGGRLILAIENQVGLKYLAGHGEDHVGIAGYGVEDRYSASDPVTFGRAELSRRLRDAGLPRQSWWVPMPDYKLPRVVVEGTALESAGQLDGLDDLLAEAMSVEDPGGRPGWFSVPRAWRVMRRNGLGLELANSFLVFASEDGCLPESHAVPPVHHFSSNRRPEYAKTTRFRRGPAGPIVEVRRVFPDRAPCPGAKVTQRIDPSPRFEKGVLWSARLREILTTPGWGVADLTGWSDVWLRALLARAALGREGITLETAVPGDLVDAVPRNLVVAGGEPPHFIDLEWTWHEPVPLGFALVRGLFLSLFEVVRVARPLEGVRLDRLGLFRELAASLGLPAARIDIAAILALESDFQSSTCGHCDMDINSLMSSRFELLPDNPAAHGRGRSSRHGDDRTSPPNGLRNTIAERMRGMSDEISRRDLEVKALTGEVRRLEGRLARRVIELIEARRDEDAFRRDSRRWSGAVEGLSRAEEVASLEATLASMALADRDRTIEDMSSRLARMESSLADLEVGLRQSSEEVRARDARLRDLDDMPFPRVLAHRVARRLREMLWARIVRESPLFDRQWYRGKISVGGLDPALHYVRKGWREGIDPGPCFDADYYVTANPTVRGFRLPPLVHYERYGRAAGLRFSSALDIDWMHRSARRRPVVSAGPDRSRLRISVVMPTYNRKEMLPAIIEAWRSVGTRINFPWEMIVADDGSVDGTAEYLESVQGLPVKVLRLPHLGAAHARNAAIRAAAGERILFVGDDIHPEADLIERHLSAHPQPGTDVATLGLVDWHPDSGCRHLLHHITEIGHEQFSYGCFPPGGWVDFRHLYTCNVCVPRSALARQEVLFDPRFTGAAFEDTELGYRLARDGLRIRFEPAAKARHLHPYEVRGFARRQEFAGRMAHVLATIHPELAWMVAPVAKGFRGGGWRGCWEGRFGRIIDRCEQYEHAVTFAGSDLACALRRCLSGIYGRLFRAQFDHGYLQAEGMSQDQSRRRSLACHFSGFPAAWLDSVPAEASPATMEAVGSVLRGERDKSEAGAPVRDWLEEIATVRLVLDRSASSRPVAVSTRLAREAWVDPAEFIRRVPDRWARLGGALRPRLRDRPEPTASTPTAGSSQAAPSSPHRPSEAHAGLILDPREDADGTIRGAFLATFGPDSHIYEREEGEGVRMVHPERGDPRPSGTVGARVLMRPTSPSMFDPPERVRSASMALAAHGVSLALMSESLEEKALGLHGDVRESLLFTPEIAEAVLGSSLAGRSFEGLILRMPRGIPPTRTVDPSEALGARLDFLERGRFRSGPADPPNVSPRLHAWPTRPAVNAERPLVLVLPAFLAVGGVERNAIEVMKRLRGKFRFVVVTTERLRTEQGSLAADAMRAGAEVIELAEIAPLASHLAMLALLKDEFEPDLVWICNGWPWLADNAVGVRALFRDIPVVDQQSYDHERGWIEHFRRPGMDSWDRYIAINRKIERVFIDRFGLGPAKVRLIRPAIDSARVRGVIAAGEARSDIRRQFSLPASGRIFAFVGRLTGQKRPERFLDLVEARREFPEESFVLVGDGELREKVRARIDARSLNRVAVIPHVADVPRLLRGCDGIIFTSEYEGLPIAMLEAMAVGTPCLATDVGDIRETLEEFGGGFTVPAEASSGEFVARFDDWQGFLPLHAANLEAARDRIFEQFAGEQVARRYEALWTELLAMRHAPRSRPELPTGRGC